MNVSALTTTPSVAFETEEVTVSVSAPRATIEIEAPDINIAFTVPSADVSTGTQIVRDTGDIPIYHGECEVTPSLEAQTLSTQGKYVPSDIVINPIPSNYGLITWNGSTITVS